MISWILGSTTLAVDDRENGIYLLGTDGFGIPDFHRIEERGPLQHGVTDRGYRLDARIINLVLGIKGSDLTDFYQKRSDLMSLFKPSNTAGKLRWEQNGVIRQVEGYLIGGLGLSDNERSHLYQKIAISIKCPDPTWYDPNGNYIGFGMGGGTDTFEVPLVIPMTLGASSINASELIVYDGSVRSYPIIVITGPITNCKIVNNTTGDKIDFTGYSIVAGDSYTIDLRYGYKTVVDASGASQISKLSTDSNLASFCIESSPIALSGVNSISVTGTGATAETSISMNFYDRYIGL